MTPRRRSAVALLAAGTACLASIGLPLMNATADDAPGSGLGSFNLAASSPAFQFEFNEPSYCYGTKAGSNGCEGVLPEAVATLRNGPIGTGLAAVVWPGTLASGAGSLLITASSGQVPAGATALNDPVKAEAHTSTGPDTVTYDTVPGTTMKAVAKDTLVSADASISNAMSTPIGTVGNIVGNSVSQLTGPKTASAQAHSSVSDITIAGVVHIGSVTSDARATTDGTTAKVTGTTVVSNVTIAGIPVTITDKGISVLSTPLLNQSAATNTVNAAISSAGLTIVLAEPTGKPKGASVDYSTGSLVLAFKTAQGYAATAVLGGANVSVLASPGLPAFSFPGFNPGGSGGTSGGATGGTTGGTAGGSNVPLGGGVSIPGNLGTLPQSPTISGGANATPPRLTNTAAHSGLPGGTSPWFAIVGLFGSVLLAAGFRRLPDRVLQTPPPTCLFEENA